MKPVDENICIFSVFIWPALDVGYVPFVFVPDSRGRCLTSGKAGYGWNQEQKTYSCSLCLSLTLDVRHHFLAFITPSFGAELSARIHYHKSEIERDPERSCEINNNNNNK